MNCSKDRLIASTVVVLLHIALAFWVFAPTPQRELVSMSDRPALEVVIIKAVSLTVPDQAPAEPIAADQSVTSSAHTRQTLAHTVQPAPANTRSSLRAVELEADEGATTSSEPSLRLSVPTDVIKSQESVPSANPFDRANPITYRSTRFASAYVPEGNIVRQIAHRSRIANVALSATGALDDPPCTEREREENPLKCRPEMRP